MSVHFYNLQAKIYKYTAWLKNSKINPRKAVMIKCLKQVAEEASDTAAVAIGEVKSAHRKTCFCLQFSAQHL